VKHDVANIQRVYSEVRARSLEICSPLEIDDYGVQPEPDVSPPKWHLAHATWFFETFVLRRYLKGFEPYNEAFGYLFNSYYEGEGARLLRERRGTVSRPTVKEVVGYRKAVDKQIESLLRESGREDGAKIGELIILGIQHEQQHQELLLTDIKAILAANSSRPAYGCDSNEGRLWSRATCARGEYVDIRLRDEVVCVGADAGDFCFDNERPRHRCLVPPFEIAASLVTNREFVQFVEDGGYDGASLWLADGWNTVQCAGWKAPRYWRKASGGWRYYTLAGERPLDLDAPVSHVSFYEADAFARWKGARLPTEEEWEVAAEASNERLADLFGAVWQWTASAYRPYLGFVPLDGTIGEYNGKFMCNQMVLRGSSWATPEGHSRATYRNFFPCDKRWQATGIRLARSV
jgi:ergothioneine biosynthesis protein EgtB